jgi:imidazolonepropionase
MPALTRTLWRHARIATLAPARGLGLARRWRLLTEGPQITLGGPMATDCRRHAGGRRARSRRRPAHAGPDRRPHPPGLRRRPRGRIRTAPAGRQLRSHRPAGGGIRSTVAATRAASDDQLFASAAARARALMAEGVTTLEIKSGYGLSAARSTLPGRGTAPGPRVAVDRAHHLAGRARLPPEFEGRADDYIDASAPGCRSSCRPGLVDAVDAFCDTIGFTPAQTERVFRAARRWACRSSCMPSSSATRAARRWRRVTAR